MSSYIHPVSIEYREYASDHFASGNSKDAIACALIGLLISVQSIEDTAVYVSKALWAIAKHFDPGLEP